MSLYNGPPRGGTRGGKDQFNWDNVKADPDREFYLGHSVKATTGRWQKGKDVFWYTREKKDDDGSQAAEMLAIKQREEDLMAEALGIKPRTLRPLARPKLDKKDVTQLLSRGEEGEEPDPAAEADRIKGLGFAATARMSMDEPEREVLAGVGLDRPLPPPPGRPAAPQAAPGPLPGGGPPPSGNGALPGPPAVPAAALKLVKKAQKKAAKEARKEERAAAKADRKARKRAKRERREREAPSPPSSPSSGGRGGAQGLGQGLGAGAEPGARGEALRLRHDSPSASPPGDRDRAGGDERSGEPARRPCDSLGLEHEPERRERAGTGGHARSREDPPRSRRPRHDSLSPDCEGRGGAGGHGRAREDSPPRVRQRRHDSPSPPRRNERRRSRSPRRR